MFHDEAIDIDGELIELASLWHDGQSSMLYAVSSTGGLTLGSIRPYDNDAKRYLTDHEWEVSLWSSLECELCRCVTLAEESTDDDASEQLDGLTRFHSFVETTLADLRTEYGLEDSDVC